MQCTYTQSHGFPFLANFEFSAASHQWSQLREGVQNHIASLNWGYKVALRDKNVTFVNGYAEFVDEHTIKVNACI